MGASFKSATQAAAIAAAIASAAALPAIAQAKVFNRIASFAVTDNLPEGSDIKTETSPEIIAISQDGQTLVYSDSPLGALGFVDITDPAAPKPLGTLKLDAEPTSVAVIGGKALVALNTSENYTATGGELLVIDIASRELEATCTLGGQPDSVAIAKDGSFVAVAIENERDEDLNDGVIPQMPAGYVAILPISGEAVDCGALIEADVTGLAEIAGSDPEPEFVDINAAGEIVVTMQENNHLAVLDRTGAVLAHFSAGAVDIADIDTAKDKKFDFTSSLTGVKREPDAVKWLDNDRFVIANEGDYEGGSRGFSIFNKAGDVLFDSGNMLEHLAAQLGHYPDKRAGKKGVEPEGLEVATFDGQQYIFVLFERASLVAVFKDTGAAPEFVQALPSGVGPEGAIAIPARGLFVTANEADLIEDKGARAHVMIYQMQDADPVYPHIMSGKQDGHPIGWGALSGLAADASTPGKLYAVNDSFYAAQPSIFEIDATASPAVITRRIPVTRDGAAAEKLDLEGITLDGQGGFWLASEGNAKKEIPHALYHVNASGEITETVDFPAALLEHQERFGSEGIAMTGDVLWVAIQREWKDDPKGMVKLLAYDTAAKTWGAVHYPLDPKGAGWVGVSEITVHGDHAYIIERDNQIGQAAALKKLYKVALSQLTPAPLGSKLPVVSKELAHDFLPDLKATGGYVVDKIEGFTIDANGIGYAVTDNDGVDDSSGETLFFSLGKM
ncbi:MAG: esterase-like activity of phytase family protein [Neomegalonema sp.]|nr:esterase-like activity of phytase family protein [Neomegalonema sp.]